MDYKEKEALNDFEKKKMFSQKHDELSAKWFKNPSEDFIIMKVRYRCADCDWSSPWGGRSQLKPCLEEHTKETGHEYFFTDSSKED